MADKTSPRLANDSVLLKELERRYKFTWSQLICDYIRDDLITPSEVAQFLLDLIAGNRDAQAKKIYEWGNEPCPHPDHVRYMFPRRACKGCWQLLLEKEG